MSSLRIPMDAAGFCAQSRVLIVAGKGGVGKTTVTAAVARMAALAGLATLVVEVEGTSGLGAAFGRPGPTAYDEVVLAAGGGPDGAADVRARTLRADDTLVEYLEDHGLRRISKRLLSSGAIDVVATAAPGIEDILVLGKVKQLERARVADLIVLDAPAAGHAVTFLAAASGLLDAVRVGPVRTQAQDVLELLTDPARCRVLLVTLPEETPVNEAVETAQRLEDRVGVTVGLVVVNGLYPRIDGLDVDPADIGGIDATTLRPEDVETLRPGDVEALRDAAAFRRERTALQAEQVARLRAMLPLPQLHLPFLFTTELGLPEVDTLADALRDEVAKL